MVEKYGWIDYSIGRFYVLSEFKISETVSDGRGDGTLHAVVSEWILYRDMEKTMGSTELF